MSAAEGAMTTADSAPATGRGTPRWRDPALPVPDRVDALLAEMTLPEKVAQLGSRWVGNDTAAGKDDSQPH